MQKISVNMEKISTARRQERQQKNTHKTYSIVMQTLKSIRKHTNDGAYTSDTFACALFHKAPNGIHVVHVKILSTGRMTAAIDCKNRKKKKKKKNGVQLFRHVTRYITTTSIERYPDKWKQTANIYFFMLRKHSLLLLLFHFKYAEPYYLQQRKNEIEKYREREQIKRLEGIVEKCKATTYS